MQNSFNFKFENIGDKNNTEAAISRNFIDYRCLDPLAIDMNQPWFRVNDICPCDPSQSNPTGRGFTGCPYGVSFEAEDTKVKPLVRLELNDDYKYVPTPVTNLPYGSLYAPMSYVPPNLQPRALMRVGNTWRS